MGKTIKSSVRELIYKMIMNFQNIKEEMESVREQKEQCLHEILTSTTDLSAALRITITNSVQKIKELDKLNMSTEATYIEKICSMTGVSARTIRQIKHEGKSNLGIWRTPGKKRKCRAVKRNIDDFDKSAIRNLINEFYLVRNEVPTVGKLLAELRQTIQFDGGYETLRKIMHDMGFYFKKNVEERTVLMEKNDIAAARHKYIRKITQYRNMPAEERKQIVYLDETYIHVNYKPKKSWQDPSSSKMVTNIAKGKRFIIVHAGTEFGFVSNALLIFSSKSKSADYHDDMKAENFSKWVQEKLLPNLNAPSIIVMDNASYHTIQVNRAPNTGSRKHVIREWLTSMNVPWEEAFTKAELLTIVKSNKPEPVYYIDEILKAHGHEVLRLPPYHCHLNTIELIWSMVKRKVGSVNVKSSNRDMVAKVEQTFESISADDWRKCAEHVKKLEEEHRQQDRLLDDMEPFIINVQSDDDSDEMENNEAVEYSEEEYEREDDLPDEEDKKSPVLLLGVNKISDSPSFVRRRSTDPHTSGSIRFFRPPKSKYTRGLNGDERLEKIRQDLLVHKHRPDTYIPKASHDVSVEPDRKTCIKLSCVGSCICDRNKYSSNRGSFSFHRPEQRQSSLCPSEPYGADRRDSSENDIEFKYTEHIPDSQPSSSKQNSYNVTPKSTERRHFLLANLNERFRKTLSLDSRKIETNRVPLSLPQENRPKSLVNTSNICVQQYKSGDPFIAPNFEKTSQPKKKRKSFFSLDTFFDSKKSDTSSIDDYCSSKYKRFELESDDSPLFRREISPQNREKTPDLLNLPVIIDSVRKKQSNTRRQLEKLEKHYYKSLCKPQTVVDAVPADATDAQGPSGHSNQLFVYDDDVEYIEPIRSNFTSQSTLILDKNDTLTGTLKPDSILTINTDETDIKLPSSTVSPKSNDVRSSEDLDSIGPYEIEVKEADLLKDCSKKLIVKVMDKSVDSIGSCSLDVDASTDFSDTTSGSLNLLTPSSTTSRIRDFTSRIQERAASNLQPNYLAPTPALTPIRTPDDQTPTPRKSDNLLKPPPKIHIDTASHRSRSHQKKRDEIPQKKPSYLNLACSVNGYTNLTTYDSKLRQDINKSREASPIRPITHNYQYRSENTNLLVPVPVSANKLLVPTFGPHDTRVDLTPKAPSKAHTDPYLASPLHAYMAAENKQLKNDFLGPSMTTASRPYISSESKNFAASMLHQKDEVDNAKEIFKSSYSETNFRQTVTTNGKESRFSSESYTISSNGVSKRVEITKENGEKLTSPMKSFIQQRVERLYGPGALAQGFFNQKRYKMKSQSEDDEPKVLTEKSLNCPSDRLVSPRKSNESMDSENMLSPTEVDASVLPVLRHLRPEFRAQLPILSPKKSFKSDLSPQKPEQDIPKPVKTDSVESESDLVTNGVSVINLDDSVKEVNGVNGEANGEVVKDAYYFLDLEKKETERLIALAVSAEKELELLQNQDNVSEEVLGLLRSASGKARLLATQKMQQFEGLCYNNINERLDEPFPTTVEDLCGFWDMVLLQVRNVDALFQHIATLKQNNWQEVVSPVSKPSSQASTSPARARSRGTPLVKNEKARLAAEKREADRKAMLEHRRRVARERQQAARAAPGTSRENDSDTPIEGSQEVEIFVGKNAKPKDAPKGDCTDRDAEQS